MSPLKQVTSGPSVRSSAEPEMAPAVAWLERLKQKLPADSAVRRLWGALRSRYRQPKGLGSRLLSTFGRIRPDAFFIQIGSNDGVTFDPLHAEILKTRWRGIMIEPVPHIFHRLRQNCVRYKDRVVFENIAIASSDGSMPFYYLRPAADSEKANLPVFYDLLGSFNRDIILSHAPYIPDIADRLVSTQVTCLTFESLCRKHDVKQVDLLHIDAEGYDFEILKSINFENYRPRILIFEHFHLTPADHATCRSQLRAHGYELLEWGMDTWCLNLRDLRGPEARLEKLWRRLNPRG